MKTKEELNTIKEEVEALNNKLAELTEDELKQVVGGLQNTGSGYLYCPYCKSWQPASAGLIIRSLPTYVCSTCGGLFDSSGYPLDSNTFERIKII